jgi:peroxiredoxin
MKTRDALIGLFVVSLVTVPGYLWLAPTGMKDSPEISLTSIDSNEIQLAKLRGRPLLVTFWATTCPGCIKEIPHLIELYEELSPRGLEIIGIAMDYDPPNQVLAARDARGITYPIALDIHARASAAFGNVRLTPTSFLIDPDGKIVFQKTGEMDMASVRQKILDMLDSSHTVMHNTPSLQSHSGSSY